MNQEPSLMKMSIKAFFKDFYLHREYFKLQVLNQEFIEAI